MTAGASASVDHASVARPPLRTRAREALTGYRALAAPAFIVLFLITIVPIIHAGWVSLHDWNLVDPEGPTLVGPSKYLDTLQDPVFWGSVGRTIYQVGGTVTLQLIIGLTIALLLNRQFRGVRFVRSAYLIPMMMTPVVVGIVWKMLLNTDFGFINYLLSLVGIGPVNWLGSSLLAMPAIIFVDVWLSTPFVVLILLAGLQSVSEEVQEAATVDGASYFQSLRHVVLPMIKPFIILAILFRVMDSIKRFDTIYIMTGGGPGQATETLDLHAYFKGFQNFEIGAGARIALIMLVISLSISLILLRQARSPYDA